MSDDSQFEPNDDFIEGQEDRASPLELFFDLVFVFAITQLATLLASDLSWSGFARSSLILLMIWWAWACYSWATNAHNLDDLSIRFAMMTATAAAFFVAISVPDAFGSGAVTFAVSFAVLRMVHLSLLIHIAHKDPGCGYRAGLPIMGGSFAIAAIAVIVGGFVDEAIRPWLWCAAIFIDFTGPQIGRSKVNKIKLKPGHFAERYALITIVALGESVVAIGLGASKGGFTPAVTLAVLICILITSALWWAYFDYVASAAEKRLQQAKSAERTALARDGFTYLHFPIIAGIILFAVGAKDLVAHPTEPFDQAHLWCLLGGVALYLFGHLAFRWRMAHSVSKVRFFAVFLTVLPGLFFAKEDAVVVGSMLLLIMILLLTVERLQMRGRYSI